MAAGRPPCSLTEYHSPVAPACSRQSRLMTTLNKIPITSTEVITRPLEADRAHQKPGPLAVKPLRMFFQCSKHHVLLSSFFVLFTFFDPAALLPAYGRCFGGMVAPHSGQSTAILR